MNVVGYIRIQSLFRASKNKEIKKSLSNFKSRSEDRENLAMYKFTSMVKLFDISTGKCPAKYKYHNQYQTH